MDYDYEFAIDLSGAIILDGALLGSVRQKPVVEDLSPEEQELALLWLEVYDVTRHASPALPLKGVRAYRRMSTVSESPRRKRWGATSPRGEEEGRVSLEFIVPGTWRPRIDLYLRGEGLSWIGQGVGTGYTYNIMVDGAEDAADAISAFGKAML